MGTTSDKLNYLNQTKTQIRNVLISEGIEVNNNDTFRSYVEKIKALHKNIGSREITTNGTFNAKDDELDGYNQVLVNVEPNLISKTIVLPGTYKAEDDSVDGYSEVVVDIEPSSGGSATLIAKSITANGTYTAEDDNADGYSQIIVNVNAASGIAGGTVNEMVRMIDLPIYLVSSTKVIDETNYNDTSIKTMLQMLNNLVEDGDEVYEE